MGFRVRTVRLPDECGNAVISWGRGEDAWLLLDDRLTPAEMVAAFEDGVAQYRQSLERVPRQELADLVAARTGAGEVVTAEDVAAWFTLPVDIADEVVRMWVGSPLTPGAVVSKVATFAAELERFGPQVGERPPPSPSSGLT